MMDEFSKLMGFVLSVCDEYGGHNEYDENIDSRNFIINGLTVKIEIEREAKQ